jgi:putative transposase
MTKVEDRTVAKLAKEALFSDRDGLRELFQSVVQEVLEAEMTEAVGAGKGERTEGRAGYRSGYYTRGLVTRLGKIELRVPQDRYGSRRSYSSAIGVPTKRCLRRLRRCTFKGCRRGK